MQVKGSIKVKRPTEVNFKLGGSQKIFDLSARELLSHFQNDAATVECNNNNNANICIARLKQNSSGALMAQTNTVSVFVQ